MQGAQAYRHWVANFWCRLTGIANLVQAVWHRVANLVCIVQGAQAYGHWFTNFWCRLTGIGGAQSWRGKQVAVQEYGGEGVKGVRQAHDKDAIEEHGVGFKGRGLCASNLDREGLSMSGVLGSGLSFLFDSFTPSPYLFFHSHMSWGQPYNHMSMCAYVSARIMLFFARLCGCVLAPQKGRLNVA